MKEDTERSNMEVAMEAAMEAMEATKSNMEVDINNSMEVTTSMVEVGMVEVMEEGIIEEVLYFKTYQKLRSFYQNDDTSEFPLFKFPWYIIFL